MFSRFMRAQKRDVPKTAPAPSAQDIAADQRATGAALADMTDKALADIRRTPVAPVPHFQEQSEGEAIESLMNAAIPLAAHDARALQKTRYENARQRRDDELSVRLASIRA